MPVFWHILGMIGHAMASIANEFMENYIPYMEVESFNIESGAEHLNDTAYTSSPHPYIVWFPTDTDLDSSAIPHIGNTVAKNLRNVVQNVEIHIKAPDYDSAWRLMNYFVGACYNVIKGPQLILRSGRYSDKGQILQSGVVYVLEIGISMDIKDIPYRKAKVNQVDQHSKLKDGTTLVPP